ncbi:MAG: cytochrome P450 [Ktedonobacteraceae bacterium]
MSARLDINLLDVNLFREGREHDAFRTLRELAPVYYNPEPQGPGFYALTRYAHISEVLRDNTRFSSARGTQIVDKRAEGEGHPSIHNADPPLHTKLRAVAAPGFRRKLLQERRDGIRADVCRLLDATPVGEPFDFVSHVAVRLPMMVLAEFLGVSEEQREKFVDWTNIMSSGSASAVQQATARHELFAFVHTLTTAKREDPQDDLASHLSTALVDGEPLSEEQLNAYFMVMIVAGNETTRNLVSGGLEQLCLHPESLDRLRADPALIPAAVEEMVRWVSPIIQMRRTATADGDLFGQPIHAGDKVVVYFASANRDEAMFDRPGEFLIDRYPNPHMGFGLGIHNCIGAHLARLEAHVFFEELLARYQTFRLHGRGERLASNWFAGTTQLMIEWS